MYNGKTVSAIIAAAGAGKRMGGGIPKQYIDIGGKPMVTWAAEPFEKSEFVDHVCVVVNSDYDERILRYLDPETILTLGGSERQDSVYNGLRSLPGDTDIVLIHDGARPYIKSELIERVLAATALHGAAIPCVKPKDTIRTKEKTLNRDDLYAVQTPQGFDIETVLEAYESAFDQDFYGTDDASLLDRIGRQVVIVQGDYDNIKITDPSDLPASSTAERASLKIGTGYDLHRMESGRKLFLAGVEIPHEKGLLGHSDADVVTHALMDAILGALALGDIGKHFPDTDNQYKDISSMILLEDVSSKMRNAGYVIENVDITIIAEKPKLAPFMDEMIKNLAKVLETEIGRISIKATTTEGIGFVGREEGIACQAAVLLSEKTQ